MRWFDVREHYRTLLKDTAGTQQAASQAEGAPRQGKISEMLRNANRGPTVETFLKALAGIGLAPSVFFLQLEAKLRKNVSPAGDNLWQGYAPQEKHLAIVPMPHGQYIAQADGHAAVDPVPVSAPVPEDLPETTYQRLLADITARLAQSAQSPAAKAIRKTDRKVRSRRKPKPDARRRSAKDR